MKHANPMASNVTVEVQQYLDSMTKAALQDLVVALVRSACVDGDDLDGDRLIGQIRYQYRTVSVLRAEAAVEAKYARRAVNRHDIPDRFDPAERATGILQMLSTTDRAILRDCITVLLNSEPGTPLPPAGFLVKSARDKIARLTGYRAPEAWRAQGANGNLRDILEGMLRFEGTQRELRPGE